MTDYYPPLSKRVEGLLGQLFALDSRKEANALLIRITGMGSEPISSEQSDRCRIAALKLSKGDTAKLQRAVDLFYLDPRDLLMSAGFGVELDAHNKWQPKFY